LAPLPPSSSRMSRLPSSNGTIHRPLLIGVSCRSARAGATVGLAAPRSTGPPYSAGARHAGVCPHTNKNPLIPRMGSAGSPPQVSLSSLPSSPGPEQFKRPPRSPAAAFPL
jgi:hypothetical protein